MQKVNLSSPWLTFVHEIYALFGEDPEIKIVFDNEECEVKLYIDNYKKAEALMQLLPTEKQFGNVTLKITVIPANPLDDSAVSLFCRAFEGNPVLSCVKTVESVMGSFNYAVFKNEVVQFYNDQLDDPHGNKSTLYQVIAKDVFGPQDGIFYCTDVAN